MNITTMKNEMKNELVNHVIPFWEGLRDDEYGGFYGYMDFNLNLDKQAEKGCILNSRILWFFSTAYIMLKDEKLLDDAKHAFEFLKNKFYDLQNGGVYWSVDYTGNPLDSTKHTYAQSFAIYGLSAYYMASGDETALKIAYELFDLIENKCYENGGYREASDIAWNKASNEKLSENGVMAQRTMNTLLHIFEGYAELYTADKDEKVAAAMRKITDRFLNTVYNKKKHRQEVFFDENWNSLIDLHSYGHDIETAWLLDWGVELLGDDALTEKVHEMTDDLAENVYKLAFSGYSVYTECENSVDLKTQVWWVQCEAITGYVNAYQKTKDEKYLDAASKIWDFTKEKMIDSRKGSEWFWVLDEHSVPIKTEPIVEPWKCPYHNGRMLMLMQQRLDNISVQ